MRIVLSGEGTRGDLQPLIELGARLGAAGHDALVCGPPDFVELGRRARRRVPAARHRGARLPRLARGRDQRGPALGMIVRRSATSASSSARACRISRRSRAAPIWSSRPGRRSRPRALRSRTASRIATSRTVLPSSLPGVRAALRSLATPARLANRVVWPLVMRPLVGARVARDQRGARARRHASPARRDGPLLRRATAARRRLGPRARARRRRVALVAGPCAAPAAQAIRCPRSWLRSSPRAGARLLRLRQHAGRRRRARPPRDPRRRRAARSSRGDRRGLGGARRRRAARGRDRHRPRPAPALFAHCAAIVHHGGAGTTANAARSGVPQLLVPHLMDQFYWAERCVELGLGAAGPGASGGFAAAGSSRRSAADPRQRGARRARPGARHAARAEARSIGPGRGAPGSFESTDHPRGV